MQSNYTFSTTSFRQLTDGAVALTTTFTTTTR